VPLLERKRLLESIVELGTLVRTSPILQPPIDSWVATWKSLGLRGGMLKAANSRYVPGGETTEWRIVERLGARR
jgi:ATP-dependent DNA ligase